MQSSASEFRRYGGASIRLLLYVVLFAAVVPSIGAQPNLNFKRIEVNWPTVELYFSVGCNGNASYEVAKQNFRISENAMKVEDFTLWCPDTSVRCAISTALVFDASGSMAGAGNTFAKAAGRMFVDQMDGTHDEAAILWFTDDVTIRQQMTWQKPLLLAAVDALPASGGTALWDGIYAGLLELINNGINQCRAVIAMTDGSDASSIRTPGEIISLANRNRIRVYTIGIGTAINPGELSMVAQQTGGKYYQSPNASQLSDIYAEVRHIIFEGFQECVITYERDCADGGMRTVEVQLDYCNGTDTKTKTYRAPLDSSTFADRQFDLGDIETMHDSVFTVPMRAVPDVLPEQLFHPLQFSLRYDPVCLEFLGADIPSGSPLEGLRLATAPTPGVVFLSTDDRKIVSGGGTLMNFRFRTLADPDTSIACVIAGEDGAFEAGCLIPRFESANVRIVAAVRPPSLRCTMEPPIVRLDSALMRLRPLPLPVALRVANEGSLPSDSVFATIVLPPHFALEGNDAPDRFTKPVYPVRIPAGKYSIAEWTVTYPPAATAKDYTVQVWTFGRDVDSALCETTVTVPALAAPRIEAVGDLAFCEGESAALDAGPGFASYRWSTGEDSRAILTDRSGSYFCVVGYPAGGTASTDTVRVTVWPPPAPPPVQRAGDSLVTIDAAGWQWFRDGQPITGATGRKHLCAQPGSYTVAITDSNGCTAVSDPFDVTVLGIAPLSGSVERFELFPYPARDEVMVHIYLRTPQHMRLVVRDLLGRALRTEGVDASNGNFIRLDLKGLRPGLYVVEAQLAAERVSKLLLIGQ